MKTLSVLFVAVVSFTVALFLIAPEHVYAGGTPSLFESGVPLLKAKSATAAPKAAAAKPAVAAPLAPDQALFLVRSTLLTLDGANRTGNYSVLRDSAAPEFQRRNSVADLALIFANLRRQGVDLGPVAILTPQIATPVAPDAQGNLRINGRMTTITPAIAFDLGFVPVEGHWRLIALAIETEPVQQAAVPQR